MEWYVVAQGKSSTTIATSRSGRCLYSYKTEAGSCELYSHWAGQLFWRIPGLRNAMFNASLDNNLND